MLKFISCLLLLTVLEPSEGTTGHNQDKGSGNTDTTTVLRIGATIPLYCKLEAKNDVSLKWFKDGEEIVPDDRIKIFNNSTLVITDAEEDDIGSYSCKSINTNPPQSFYISVITLSYRRMPKSATVFQGDRFEMNCQVEGNPHPEVEWFKDDVKVEDVFNSSHFSYENNDNGIPNATLIIQKADETDRGEFMCFITSEGIVLNTTTFVRVKDMYAALWPFIGIVGEVVILCFVIFAYEKNRFKNDLDESDTDQPAEQANTPSKQDSFHQRK